MPCKLGRCFFLHQSSIEEELGITPVAFNGGYVMYDFPLCGVTMQFSGRSQVCTELSFRLYGEDGWNMKQQLLNYGYKLQSKSEDLIAENNFGDLQTGTRSVYKVKLNSGDYSTLVLVEGQAFMFTFYRSR